MARPHKLRQPTAKVGDIFDTNYGRAVIVEYRHARDVDACFLDTGYRINCHLDNLRKGCTKDPYYPSVFGIGFLGEMKHKAVVNGKKTREYVLWTNMLQRCYDHNFKSTHTEYDGCSVCTRWHNFQNFCDDIPKLNGYAAWSDPSNRYSIDKDTLVNGNKVYSPHTCQFIPLSENVRQASLKRWGSKLY